MASASKNSKYEKFIASFLESVRPIFNQNPKLFRVTWDRESPPLYTDLDMDRLARKFSPAGKDLVKSTSFRTLMVNGFSAAYNVVGLCPEPLLESGLKILDLYWAIQDNQWNVVSRSPYVKFVLSKKVKVITIESQVTTTEIIFDWFM